MTTALDFVNFYCDKGWYIFPCKARDKTPLVQWRDEATIDAKKASAWWKQTPDANIGLATGERSGIFALDVDAGHGGIETLQTLVKENGALPDTPVSNTGGGGNHYIFNWEQDVEVRNSAGKLGAGLDTRGDGGYIVVPQSVHPNGNLYQWDINHKPSEIETAPAPGWMLKLLSNRKNIAPGTNTDGAYIAGQRNNAMISLAGTMRRRGMDEEAIFLALNVENLNKCIPPLSEDEIHNIAKSVIRYDPQAAPRLQPRDRVVAEWAFCKTIFEVPDYLSDYLGLSPNEFSVKELREYWTDVLQGTGVAQAAANCEILSELESWQEWYLPRLETYAETIKRWAHRDRASRYGWKLQRAAEAGDFEGIDRAVVEINQNVSLLENKRIVSVVDVADSIEAQVQARFENPGKIWGIPYSWNYLSEKTGGKQAGELVLLAGEPKIKKSWMAIQDALDTAVEYKTPVYIWSGEMGAEQVTRRLYQLLGVNGEHMRTGYMDENDWQKLREARAIITNSPIYIDDKPSLKLAELKAVLQHQKHEHGIKQFVLDYAFLIDAPGKDEIEKTNNVSRIVKGICRELDLAGILLSSVNKMGMDTGKAVKSSIRGSGQQIHDADVIFILTKFAPIQNDNVEFRFKPNERERLRTLHISAGRELRPDMEGGVLHFSCDIDSPRLKEELQNRKYL